MDIKLKHIIEKTITKEDVEKFMEISGDRNPIHWDNEFASKTRFKKPIAHGLITASLISRGLTEMFGRGNVWISQTLEFKQPVYIGDRLKAEFRVMGISSNNHIWNVRCVINKEIFHKEAKRCFFDLEVLNGEALCKVYEVEE